MCYIAYIYIFAVVIASGLSPSKDLDSLYIYQKVPFKLVMYVSCALSN